MELNVFQADEATIDAQEMLGLLRTAEPGDLFLLAARRLRLPSADSETLERVQITNNGFRAMANLTQSAFSHAVIAVIEDGILKFAQVPIPQNPGDSEHALLHHPILDLSSIEAALPREFPGRLHPLGFKKYALLRRIRLRWTSNEERLAVADLARETAKSSEFGTPSVQALANAWAGRNQVSQIEPSDASSKQAQIDNLNQHVADGKGRLTCFGLVVRAYGLAGHPEFQHQGFSAEDFATGAMIERAFGLAHTGPDRLSFVDV